MDSLARFSFFALACQLIISLVAMVMAFWLINESHIATVEQASTNVIIFVVGVWLGRGVEFSLRSWEAGQRLRALEEPPQDDPPPAQD